MARPPLAYRERRPSCYMSFEMACIICTAAFVSGVFAGMLLANLDLFLARIESHFL